MQILDAISKQGQYSELDIQLRQLPLLVCESLVNREVRSLTSAVTVGSPSFLKGGNPIFVLFKKGGNQKKNLGVGEKKGREFSEKKRGGTQFFKLNLGIEKNKNGDF